MTYEAKGSKELKETKNQPERKGQPSAGAHLLAESKLTPPFLQLPSGPLSNVFGFFQPKELARMAQVSSTFLSAANEPSADPASASDHILSFAAGRNAHINELLINHAD